MEYAGYCIREKRDYSREHFDTVFTWKTNGRGKSRPEKNEDAAIERALKTVALGADQPRDTIGQLTKLSGVGLPVASAIMTAVFPEKFTIIDFRALHTLSAEKYSTSSVKRYLEYVAYCNGLASDWDMTLRDLDRALWKWSEMNTGDLLRSISDKQTPTTSL